ncbi:hypothetical protein GCM10009555_064370 [Acrocarpospora macrocephala]|uniref:Uncharacterized protein n=1 Tax=Acrocarpospora macrocephala TaxID=150177 RepID=A0A5M3WMT5_9ACTN|nr:hypothetical protein Amac_012230 [Acrocarpospora macrocephala]
MRIEHLLDLGGYLFALVVHVPQRSSQVREHQRGGGGARDDDGLSLQRGRDVGGEPLGHAWGQGFGDGQELVASGGSQAVRPAVLGEQFDGRRVVQARADGFLQGGVDGDQQAADAVGQPGRFSGQVVVESDENLKLGKGFVAGVDAAQGVREGSGGVGDDVSVAGVGLGVAGVHVGQSPHGQPGQVGDLAADGSGDGHGECSDGGGLVDDDQDRSVAAELGEQGPQPVFVVGEWLVVEFLAPGVQGAGVVFALADV